MTSKLGREILIALAGVMAISANCVVAADATPAGGKPAQAGAAEATAIEEVIVTARRREENLQEVPISVTAISGEALVAKGVTDLMALQRFVPSMRVVSSDVNPKIFFVSIRGIRGQNPRLTEDPPIGTSFAEVPIAHPFAFGDELYDIQSLQVLKGPQGTLFGRNTTGGQILIEPNKPSLEDGFGGDLKLTLGRYNLRKFDGAVNIPLNDVAALRIAGESNQRDGYTKNILSGQKWDEVNNQALRVQLLLKPTRDVTSDTMVNYLDEDAAPASSVVWKVYPASTRATFGPVLGTTVANIYAQLLAAQHAAGPLKMISAVGSNVITGPVFDPVTGTVIARPGGIDAFSPAHCAANPNQLCRSGSRANEKIHVNGIENNTKVDFDGFSIKNIFGYRHMWHYISGYDLLPGGFLSQGIQPEQWNDYYQSSDEFQVNGKGLNERLDWIVGAIAFVEHGEDNSPAYQGLTPFANSAIPGSPQSWTDNRNRDVNKSHALFAQGDYKLTDQWKGTVGLRKTWDDRAIDDLNNAANYTVATNTWTRVCSARNAAGVPLPINACDLHGNTTSSAVSWNLSLQYQADADTMYYGSLKRGYKSGGFSPLINIPQRLAFQPEFVRDLELGVKSDWSLAGMPVRTNAALFYDWYTNEQLQVSTFNPGVGFSNYIDNVGKSHIKGGELEFTLLPTSHLEISGFVSYVKAIYDSYLSHLPNGATVDFTQAEFGQNYAIPHWQGALSASYKLPLDNNNGMLKFSGDLTLRSKAPTDANNANIAKYAAIGAAFTPQIVEPGRGVLNLRVDWNHPLGNPVNLAVYVNNATDKVYPLGGTPIVGVETVHLGEPRMYGVELSYKFGEGFKPKE